MSIDLLASGIVDDATLAEFADGARRHARPAVLRGDVDSSLEESDTRIEYRLLDGIGVQDHLPVLDNLYRSTFLEIAERGCGYGLAVSPDVRNGINLNVVEGVASRYEWHFDTNPITGLLVLSDSDRTVGGRLLFGRESSLQVPLSLRAGQLLIFDAREAAHSVEPLRHNWSRVTAPMNFFQRNQPVARPVGIDEALYGPS